METKINNLFEKHIAFGGLMELNESSILLRNKQIEDGVKIHTCNDYNNSIEVIKEANPNKKQTKIILKVYYNYPTPNNRRYRSIISQIDEFIERLTFIPNDLILQICCYFPLDILKKKFFLIFLERINRDYGIKKIYFEYYPVYKYNLENIKFFFSELNKNIDFGFTGYYNLFNRVLSKGNYNIIDSQKIPFIPIGILGKNKVRDLQIDFTKTFSRDQVDINLLFLKTQINKNQNVFGITETSNYSNYLDLKKRFNTLNIIDDNLYNKLEKVDFNLIKRDQYGGKYYFIDYIKKPKLFPSKVIKLFIKTKPKTYFFK